ncbi:MAG: hypothetical protein IKJ50_02400, partial [Clostridia bacterium]|nr:hypothetical protein [Clostridia bacterium]
LNLWNILEHDKYYFANGTNWSIYSGGTVKSVTISVEPGDKIFATAFGKAGQNGHVTSNGIRVTFFSAYGVAKTLSPTECYAEFSKNGGHLITPEGAIAINVAMWNDSNENELYILNRDHTYENGVCTVCGAEHPNLANYEGKVISILSASTSTFAGYIPAADGFNLEHRARYPQDNLLTDVNDTWWMQLINELDAQLGINDSWAGSQVLNTQDTNSGDLGPDACMASLTRIQNLGANGAPDLILFFGAGNDMGRGVPLGSFDPATAPTEVDLTATKWETLADAYVAAIMRLQYFYPDAEIVVMTTYAMPSYVTNAKLDKYGPVLKAICDHYGVKTVDLRNSGVTFDMLPDKIHPNAEGMDHITDYVLQSLLKEVEMEAGEHTVHSVTHNLTNANTSRHYYKGVSHDKPFVETVSGLDVTVTVTMGGVDITATAYADGVISIPSVTGDLVITVKGRFDADGHLQQLPENLCAGTNLWTALEPENIYYTVNGWGNVSAGTAWSITFPVQAGDQIWATSFGKSGENGDTANGVRVTWFDENGVLATVDRNTVYNEFVANGHITAPDGALALNVTMASNNPNFKVYILNRDHCYKDEFDAFCDGCNAIREINYPAESVELREIDGVKYIYVNGRTSVEGLFKIDDDYYCATWGGVVLTGDQYVHLSYCDKPAGRHFYFSEDGKMLDKGFVIGEDGIKRLYVDSRTSVEGLFEVDGKYYLATWGGVVLTDGRYYISESFVDGIDGGRNFTVGSDGKILDGVVEIDGQKYYYDFGTTVFPGIYEIEGIEYTVTWGGLIEE